MDLGIYLSFPCFVLGFLVQGFDRLAVKLIAVRVSNVDVDEEEDNGSEEEPLWMVSAHGVNSFRMQ